MTLPCVDCPTLSDDALSVTVTVATGAGGGGGTVPTVKVSVALFPSLVAVIVATPAPTARSFPLALTVATSDLDEENAIVRPV